MCLEMMKRLHTLFRVYRREFRLIFSDVGVMLFFFFLTALYPVVYTLIYNPETLTDLPFAVVDHDRTQQSRELVRALDATQGMATYDYAPDLAAAREMVNSHDAYAVLEIPSGYGRKLGSGEQAVATFYSDMSLLLRYRTFLSCLTHFHSLRFLPYLTSALIPPDLHFLSKNKLTSQGYQLNTT